MSNNNNGFLSKVAGFLIENCETPLHKVCIVLPNRRAGLFLKNEIAQRLVRPLFIPAIFSIEDFVYEITELRKADPAELLLELFDVYRSESGSHADDFETFLKWGQMAINDFDDIDQYLTDSQQLFTYFTDARAIELWNPQGTPITEKQQRYLDFFKALHPIYDQFSQKLLESGKAYNGLAFRQSSKTFSNSRLNFTFNRFIFAGFSFHTPAEKKLIETISGVSMIDEFFDADRYYVDDQNNEAGKSLRQIIRAIKPENFYWLDDQLCKNPLQITITSVAGRIAQARFAGQLLSQLNQHQLDDTALVLCDENLLMPVLNSLPGSITSFNVTMGYPVRLSQMYTLIESIFELHLHAGVNLPQLNTASEAKQDAQYYLRDVLALFQNPLLLQLAKNESIDISQITSLMRNTGKVILNVREIGNLFTLYGNMPFWVISIITPWLNPEDFLDRIAGLLNHFISHSPTPQFADEQYSIDYSSATALLDSIVMTRKHIAAKSIPITLKGLHNLFSAITDRINLPFSGEPLSGLQILGMLETRLLDFTNVVMLSVNEGVIPPGKTRQSFFPFDIRKQFGLPVYSDSESVAAYHFYRLLQRAQTVHLVYNSIGNDFGGGEQSRFIRQIQYELKKVNPQATITTFNYSLQVQTGHINQPTEVQKNPDILKHLLALASNGLSPSAISCFVACRLRFYFRYIIGIEEEDEVSETMDSATFGQVVHHALKIIYEPYLTTPLTEAMLKDAKLQISNLLAQSFATHYQGGDLRYGENFLLKEVAETYLHNLLTIDEEWVKKLKISGQILKLHALESKLSTILPVEITTEQGANITLNLKIKGTADRIDESGGAIRIIDYKTGIVDVKDVIVQEWDSLAVDHTKEKALQLLIYAWIYAREYNSPIPEAGIISLRRPSKGLMKVVYPQEPDNHVSDKIETVVGTIVKSMFDASESFSQTTNHKTCTHCAYRTVCHR